MAINSAVFKGSEWRKWDLHFHTPSSYDYENKSVSNKELVDCLISNAIEAVVITDHHNLDTSRIAELRKISNGQVTILPGIELRSELGGSESIHFVGIFPEDTDLDTLWTKLQGELNLTAKDVKDKSDEKIYCTFEKASKLIHKLGGLVSIHAGSKSNSIERITNALPYKQAIKEDILENIDIFEVGKPEDIEEYRKKVYPEIKKHPPIVIASDSHNAKDYKEKAALWIKGDATFEGLRQTLYEPEFRVLVGLKPQLPLFSIDEVDFDFPEGTLIGEDKFCMIGKNQIGFSPNLTCLIGGRGSGKSTILNLIYEKLKPHEARFFEENKLTIPNKKSIGDCVSVDEGDEEKYVEFLSQNEIEQFALDHKKFTLAIYQRIQKLDSEGKLSELQQELGSELSATDNQITNLFTRRAKINEINGKRKELESYNKVVDSVKSEEYKQITSKISSLSIELKNLGQSKEKYEELVGEFDKLLKLFHIKTGNDLNRYEIEFNRLVTELGKITASSKAIDFSKIKEEEKEKGESLLRLQSELRTFLEKQGLSKEDLNDISGANIKIGQLQSTIAFLEKHKTLLDEAIRGFDDSKLGGVKEDYENELKKQISPVSELLKKLDKQVKPINLEYEFDEKSAGEVLIDKFQDLFLKSRDDYLSQYLFRMKPTDVLVSTSQSLIQKIKGEDRILGKTQENLVRLFSDEENFEIYKLLIQRIYFDLISFKIVKVLYDGKPLLNSSFGQRCTAAIIILLLLGNNPIVIDEPEAHLDSSLIANYLVDVIKKRKQNRQIIFATHNANFVINGDAELVHILEIEDGLTKIQSTTIENLQYRAKLLELEGGKEAFELRGEKYQL